MVKRSELSCEARAHARERARARYCKNRDPQCARAYLRLLGMGKIRHPRAASVLKYDLVEEDGSWRARSSDENRNSATT